MHWRMFSSVSGPQGLHTPQVRLHSVSRQDQIFPGVHNPPQSSQGSLGSSEMDFCIMYGLFREFGLCLVFCFVLGLIDNFTGLTTFELFKDKLKSKPER